MVAGHVITDGSRGAFSITATLFIANQLKPHDLSVFISSSWACYIKR